MELEALATEVVDLGYQIHRELGPGLLESAYEVVLASALEGQGFIVERQRRVDITFKSITIPDAFRADLVVDRRLIIEVKSVEKLAGVHAKQLLTYLRLLDQPLGLLINFWRRTLPRWCPPGGQRSFILRANAATMTFVPSCLRVKP